MWRDWSDDELRARLTNLKEVGRLPEAFREPGAVDAAVSRREDELLGVLLDQVFGEPFGGSSPG